MDFTKPINFFLSQHKYFLQLYILLQSRSIIYRCASDIKQAGTGPSRRHIQGSKIAERLPSVKYSFTVVENQKFFEIFF